MIVETYPSTIICDLNFEIMSQFQTIHSQFDSKVGQSLRIYRFPTHIISPIRYSLATQADRDSLFEFWRDKYGDATRFWFFDFIQRKWFDEYMGQGGPLAMKGAVADDGGTLTDETDEANDATASDMTLLPAAPAVNDAYYFIAPGQFDKLTLWMGTAGAGSWTITWEYHDTDDTWNALSGVTDGTTGFTAAPGSHDVTFTMPSDWAMSEIDGIVGHAIRARVSAFSSISTQPKGTQATINSHYYDLPSKSTVNDSTLKIYVDDVLKTGGGTDYTFVNGGGAGGADRINFNSYPTQGDLITCSFQGKLRLYARFNEQDSFREPIISQAPNYQIQLGLMEVGR